MDQDRRFETSVNEDCLKREGIKTMSEWLTRVISESEAKGRLEGHAEGHAEGREEGREEERVSGIRNVMNKLGYSAEKAMDFMNIPTSEQPKYALLLKES